MAFSSLQDLQTILAQSFFSGDVGIAGMIMFTGILAFVFVFFARKNIMVGFAIMLPLTVIFSTLGVLPETMAVLLVLIAVIGLSKMIRDTMAE